MQAQETQQGTKGQTGAAQPSNASHRSVWTSRFLLAALAFLALNFLAARNQWGISRAVDFPEMTWTGWAVRDFLCSPQRPNVVFLGSSLMLVPIAGTDADYLGKRLDGTKHHSSVYFESRLKDRTARGVKTFNFALPGQMPSDAYLITDFLLRGKKKPDMIVYGLGPRDFMDSLLPSPAATDPYRYLARFGDVGSIASRAMPDFWGRLNYELGRLVYFYGQKTDLSNNAARLAAADVNGMLPLPPGAVAQPIFERRRILPDFRPCELVSGEAFFRPATAADRGKFTDNLEEYRKRYKDVRWDTFMSQMEFLAGTLNIARDRGIKVVLVMMPITNVNRSLLQDYAWDAYRTSVHVLANSKGAEYYDLGASGQFNDRDFCDTVHLHSGGGKKMLDLLVDRLLCDRAAKTALNIPGGSVAPADVQPDKPALAAAKKDVL